ncbi:hypothetical protein PHLCEN_2v7107 [Hermanssonia centrifuga]|uniref:peptidylprolyl isomerase n=1 Tax=Hermanssonia centrifuga TaxID=98765 RepID=A0A2R6NXM3_9APHY|nr:hypothetical protein PHLCEN_2v7107 [Hermanssonia centrifuga]
MQLFNWLSLFLFAFVVSAAEPPTELQIDTTFKPDDCSVTAKTGDKIKVHYVMGVGQVIRGWDEGLQGMCLNEKRILTIPSTMAYGSRGFGSVIPANSALVFDVELVGLESTGKREEL